MQFQKYFFILMFLLLSGCISPYPEVQDVKNSAEIIFERDAQTSFMGSGTYFNEVKTNVNCSNINKELGNGIRMATLSSGVPLLSDKNSSEIRVGAQPQFKIYLRSGIGKNYCDMFIEFNIQAKEKYKIIAYSDIGLAFHNGGCSAKLFQKEFHSDLKFKEISFNKSEICK